ncbi:MAG: division/cell wall cluster transcriptional repressor MraZ [Acidimicrobiia bacterium]|nr:division/cell wall cluster transcriptional repressor MraZ [Acidimicrobiia bacterium]
MFVGVYERQLDERGRVALPPTFRTELGEHCYLTFGDDGCVSIRSDQSFESEASELIEKVKRGEMSRDRQRAFASSATPATVDRQGRITLDATLRAQANIEPQAGVMVLGSLDQIEIWEPEAFQAHEQAGRSEIAGGDGSGAVDGGDT